MNNMTTFSRLIVGGLMALSLTACAAAASRPEAAMPAPALPAEAPSAAERAAGNASEPGQTDQAATNRLIIRTADLMLIVKDAQAQLDAINKIAADYGGYIVSSSTSRREDEVQAQVTFRVDARQLDPALDRLRKLAVEVRSESVHGEDVTAEYVDLNARLKNLEAAEAQLQEIMKKAEKTEDVLAVYQQLTEIRGQIEQIKGRMQYLSQSAALATINATLIPDKLAQPVQIAGWRPDGVAKTAIEALISALQGLASLLIWITLFVLPILIVLAIPVVILALIIRGLIRRAKTKASAPKAS